MTVVKTDPKPISDAFKARLSLLPAINWLTSGFVYASLSLNRFTRSLQTLKNLTVNERVTQILDKERCIKEQIYFELLYVSCIKFTS